MSNASSPSGKRSPGQPFIDPTRAVAKSIIDIRSTYVDEYGSATIPVLKHWLERDVGLPRGFNHERGDGCHYFAPYLRSHEDNPIGSTGVLWLGPDAYDPGIPVDEAQTRLEARVTAMTDKLSAQFGVPMEAQIYYPSEDFLERTDHEGVAAVVLATEPKYDSLLQYEILPFIQQEQRAAEHAAHAWPKRKFLGEATSWQERMLRDADRSADSIAMQDALSDVQDDVPPYDVTIGDDGIAQFTLDADTAFHWGGAQDWPLSIRVQSDHITSNKHVHGTQALMLWMAPGFYDPEDYKAARGRLRNETDDDVGNRLFDEELRPKVQALCEALSRRAGGIPIEPALCHFSRSNLPQIATEAPCALVLMTTPEHQDALRELQHTIDTCRWQIEEDEAARDDQDRGRR